MSSTTEYDLRVGVTHCDLRMLSPSLLAGSTGVYLKLWLDASQNSAVSSTPVPPSSGASLSLLDSALPPLTASWANSTRRFLTKELVIALFVKRPSALDREVAVARAAVHNLATGPKEQRLTLRPRGDVASMPAAALAELSLDVAISSRAASRARLETLELQWDAPAAAPPQGCTAMLWLEGDGVPLLLPAEAALVERAGGAARGASVLAISEPLSSRPFRVGLPQLLGGGLRIALAPAGVHFTGEDALPARLSACAASAVLSVLERPGFREEERFAFDLPLRACGEAADGLGPLLGRARGTLSWSGFPLLAHMVRGLHAEGAVSGGQLLSDALPVGSRPTCATDAPFPPLLRAGFYNYRLGLLAPTPAPEPSPPAGPPRAPAPLAAPPAEEQQQLSSALEALQLPSSERSLDGMEPRQAASAGERWQREQAQAQAQAEAEAQAQAAMQAAANAAAAEAAAEHVAAAEAAAAEAAAAEAAAAEAAAAEAAAAEAAAAEAAAAEAAAASARPSVSLPWFWTRDKDPSGKVYFLNHLTSSTAWRLPASPLYDVCIAGEGPLGLQLEVPASQLLPPEARPRPRGAPGAPAPPAQPGADALCDEEGGLLTSVFVRAVMAGSLAERAGAEGPGPRAGHGIVAVNGAPVWATPLPELVAAIQRAGRPLTLRMLDPHAVAPELAAAALLPAASVASAPRPRPAEQRPAAPQPLAQALPQQQQQQGYAPQQQQQQQQGYAHQEQPSAPPGIVVAPTPLQNASPHQQAGPQYALPPVPTY